MSSAKELYLKNPSLYYPCYVRELEQQNVELIVMLIRQYDAMCEYCKCPRGEEECPLKIQTRKLIQTIIGLPIDEAIRKHIIEVKK